MFETQTAMRDRNKEFCEAKNNCENGSSQRGEIDQGSHDDDDDGLR